MSKTPALPADVAEVHRRALAAQRLARYDHNAAALVPLLRAVAARLEVGAIGENDAARLRKEAELLARCLPPEMPVYPEADHPD